MGKDWDLNPDLVPRPTYCAQGIYENWHVLTLNLQRNCEIHLKECKKAVQPIIPRHQNNSNQTSKSTLSKYAAPKRRKAKKANSWPYSHAPIKNTNRSPFCSSCRKKYIGSLLIFVGIFEKTIQTHWKVFLFWCNWNFCCWEYTLKKQFFGNRNAIYFNKKLSFGKS